MFVYHHHRHLTSTCAASAFSTSATILTEIQAWQRAVDSPKADGHLMSHRPARSQVTQNVSNPPVVQIDTCMIQAFYLDANVNFTPECSENTPGKL